jgi:chitinase
MAFDLGWDPTSHMPWSDLTEAVLFNLATQNGPGLDKSNVSEINVPNWAATAKSHGVQPFISIGGDGDSHWPNACSNTNRAQFVQNLIGYATSNGFVGVDLDIEDGGFLGTGPPNAAMTTCVNAIADAAHAAGLLLSADVITNWDGPWWTPSVAKIDQYNLMTYGDNLATMKADVAATISQGLPAAKFVVGVDVADYPEPSGGCAQFGQYATSAGLLGAFVWAAEPDTNNVCMNALAGH